MANNWLVVKAEWLEIGDVAKFQKGINNSWAKQPIKKPLRRHVHEL